MREVSREQVRRFRLHSHHLDTELSLSLNEAAGICGLQNSPPGAWETAMFQRTCCTKEELHYALYQEKDLLQAWSLRGLPVIFPASDSDMYLSALCPKGEEPWIYTRGITLALDHMKMTFDEVFTILKYVLPRLNKEYIVSKSCLDETLAEWMLPYLTQDQQVRWKSPSMYGKHLRQSVGGAIVSFLLRPASLMGKVVFTRRETVNPVFTSYDNWIGHPITIRKDAVERLVRTYVRAYGPTTPAFFANWLGCSGKQARRMWKTIEEELMPVQIEGRRAFILSADEKTLINKQPLERDLLLLGGHDPYLDQRDRDILLPKKSLHKQIWQMVSNPGAVVYKGEIIGKWTCHVKGSGLDIDICLWSHLEQEKRIPALAEAYASFHKKTIRAIRITT